MEEVAGLSMVVRKSELLGVEVATSLVRCLLALDQLSVVAIYTNGTDCELLHSICNMRAHSPSNKYERYYGPGSRPIAYLLYYMPMVSPTAA